jgi:shikimate dehydrogenase
VIGAGGGAAASVLTCLRLGAKRIVIANRTPARASALARRFSAKGVTRTAGEPRGLDALVDPELLADARLIVNATSMGLTTERFVRLAYDSTADDCLFYDLIYSREATAFLKPAMAVGRRTSDGAGMLVNQGELAFKLFNRVDAPAGVMRAALLAALGRDPRAVV